MSAAQHRLNFKAHPPAPPPDSRLEPLPDSRSCGRSSPPGLAPLRAARREGVPWILRPGVLRVAAAQFLSDLAIAPGPEPRQVRGHLHGPAGRRKQLQQHGLPAAGDARRVRAAEHLLDAHRQHGALAGVVQPEAGSGGDLDVGRRKLVQAPALRPGEQRLERGREVDPLRARPAASPRRHTLPARFPGPRSAARRRHPATRPRPAPAGGRARAAASAAGPGSRGGIR